MAGMASLIMSERRYSLIAATKEKGSAFLHRLFMSIRLEVYRLPGFACSLTEYTILFVTNETELRDPTALD